MRPLFVSLPVTQLPQAPFAYAPLLRYAVCVLTGMTCGWFLRTWVSSGMWLGMAGILCLILLLLVGVKLWGRGRRHHYAVNDTNRMSASSVFSSALLTGLCFCLLAALAACRLTAVHERQTTAWPDSITTWRANVSVVQKVYEGKGLLLTAELTPNHSAYVGKQVQLYLAGASPDQVLPGVTLLFRARIANHSGRGNPGAFDQQTYLLTHGISGTAFVPATKWTLSVTPDTPTFIHRLLRFRFQLIQRLNCYLQGEQLAILSALALGDKSQLRAEIRRPFQETGTSHVLALSGLHLGILYSLVQFFFIRPIRLHWLRMLVQGLSLISLWLFVLLTGSPLSLQRAAWMLTILQVGMYFSRGYQGTLNNLALAALLILWFSPLSLFDVGFQLSFAAVLSIAFFHRYVWALHPLPQWEDTADVKHLLNYTLKPTFHQRLLFIRYRLARAGYRFLSRVVVPFFTISLSAQLGTAPFVVYYFHQLPLYGLVGNILVIPLAYFLLSGVLLFFLIPSEAVSVALAHLLSAALQLLTEGLQALSQWPGANLTLYLHPLTLLALTLLGVGLWYFFHGPKRWRRHSIVVLGVFLFVAIFSELYAHRPQRMKPQLIVYNLPRSYAVHFIASADESYLLPSSDSLFHTAAWLDIEKNFWEPNGLQTPNCIQSPQFRTFTLQRADCLFAFCGERILWLHRSYTAAQLGHLPRARIWLIDRGCRLDPKVLCSIYRPCQVVLLPTLARGQCKRWQSICRSFAVACYDMRREGAFRYDLPVTN